ncbi:hypothetical protein J3E72DRAFT_404602, partial [Bipolaris maydis]
LLTSCFANLVLAKSHSPNCTLPPDNSNYVAGVNVRSTLDIFWSAIYTVFVCTWAVQHLNVPPPKASTPDFHWWQFWKIKIPAFFWTRLKWMLLTIIMPEYLLGAALSGYVAARKFKKYTKEPGSKGERWTTTHGYYADMGGLVYTLPETPGNFEPRLVAINSKQLRYLLDKGFLDQEPPMSEDEILDKSKGDAFATISAVVQLLWLVTQLITRKVLKLPSSQLEILALAFAVCTSFTYILNYPKPQNIQVPSHVSNLQRNQELEERASQSYFKNALWPWEDKKELEAIIRNDKLNPSSQLKILNEGKSYEWIVDADSIGFITGAVILGLCHCIAWNFQFPTPIERLLWRIASVGITGILPLFYFLWFMLTYGSDHLGKLYDYLQLPLSYISFSVYVVARLYLLVAPFRELFYLPPEAFIATWSVSLPY